MTPPLRSTMQATQSELVAENGLVVAGHPAEAEAGLAMLRAGGNAIDAVVAAAFTGFVVEPAACGLGGYGRLALFLGARGEFVTIDHYVRAPVAARADMFRVDQSRPPKYYGFPHTVGDEAEIGYRSPAVPGAVAGLCLAQERFGCLPLAQVLEPAIAAAEAGVPVRWDLVLAISERLPALARYPALAAWLLRDGTPPHLPSADAPGDRLDTSELAGTLKRIAREGAAGFYEGPVAAAIEQACLANGGLLTAGDLATYRPKLVRERPARYRDCQHVTASDPVGYEALNILDHFDLRRFGPDSLDFRHVMAEAMACAFADNMQHYGDPDFTDSPVAGLASRAFAASRAAMIRPDRALPRPVAAADPWPFDPAGGPSREPPARTSAGGLRGTSQMVAADRAGNLVTLITSLTSAFGSLVLVPGTGIILNNAMQNFDPRPGTANCIQPYKMPIFGVPTLVAGRDGRPFFAAGGSGGYRIASGVLHAFVNAVDFAMAPQSAVDAPRLHCQGGATYLDARIPAPVRAALADLGHEAIVQEQGLDGRVFGWFGRVAAIGIDPRTGLMSSGAGPAWGTAAAGY